MPEPIIGQYPKEAYGAWLAAGKPSECCSGIRDQACAAVLSSSPWVCSPECLSEWRKCNGKAEAKAERNNKKVIMKEPNSSSEARRIAKNKWKDLPFEERERLQDAEGCNEDCACAANSPTTKDWGWVCDEKCLTKWRKLYGLDLENLPPGTIIHDLRTPHNHYEILNKEHSNTYNTSVYRCKRLFPPDTLLGPAEIHVRWLVEPFGFDAWKDCPVWEVVTSPTVSTVAQQPVVEHKHETCDSCGSSLQGWKELKTKIKSLETELKDRAIDYSAFDVLQIKLEKKIDHLVFALSLHKAARMLLVICIAIEWTKVDQSNRNIPLYAVDGLDDTSKRFALLEF